MAQVVSGQGEKGCTDVHLMSHIPTARCPYLEAQAVHNRAEDVVSTTCCRGRVLLVHEIKACPCMARLQEGRRRACAVNQLGGAKTALQKWQPMHCIMARIQRRNGCQCGTIDMGVTPQQPPQQQHIVGVCPYDPPPPLLQQQPQPWFHHLLSTGKGAEQPSETSPGLQRPLTHRTMA